MLKDVAASALYWISLSLSFVVGTSKSDVFSLGYLVGGFIIIWKGSDLYLWHIRNLTKW